MMKLCAAGQRCTTMGEATRSGRGYLHQAQEIPLNFMGEKRSAVSFTEAPARTGQRG